MRTAISRTIFAPHQRFRQRGLGMGSLECERVSSENNSCLAVDAIAIRILDGNTLLVGVGNELHVHSNRSTVLPAPLRLRGKVHGIEVDAAANATDRMILVYGEKEFMLLQWQTEHNFKLLYKASLSDWISTGKFMSQAHEFVLLTAHSIAIRFRLDATVAKCSVVERSSCSDKSTLYCARLHGQCWQELVVFGGNAFGELLVWQPTVRGAGGSSLLQHRRQMHNGVIFSIDYDEAAELLTTTSDDRSIKFWQLEKNAAAPGWQQTQFALKASGYAHVARVFQAKILRIGSTLYAITVGEDSYFCLWRCDSGTLLYKRRQQFGATIWNLDFEAQTKTLYTVGSTGNVLAFDLTDVLAESEAAAVRLLPALQDAPAEYMAKVKFVTIHTLIGVSNRNRLLYKRLDVEESWQLVPLPATYEVYKCTVLEVHKDMLAICGYKRLTLLRYAGDAFSCLFDGALLGGVIRAFQFLSEEHFLVSDETGNCVLLAGSQLQLRYEIPLPQCKEPWITAALLVESQALLVSNRLGNMFVYRYELAENAYVRCDTLRQPHGSLGATALKLHELSEDSAYIHSAGHDGTLKTLRLQRASGKLTLQTHAVIPIAWVEDLLDGCEAGGEQAPILLGFNDNHFVAWSSTHDFHCQVACGGGHRCWHYTLHAADGDHWLQLAFVQHKQVRLHRLRLSNRSQSSVRLPTRNRWHVKACNVAATIESATGLLLISAGDDNAIKIFSCPQSGPLILRAQLHTHISNVRALKVLEQGADGCLIISGGGRAQLCVARLDRRTCRVQQLLSHTLEANSKPNGGLHYNCDPETRLMAVDVCASESELGYDIYLGCSDGHVRLLHMHLQETASLASRATLFCGKCVLQVRLVAQQYVAIASTDGHISIYDRQLQHMQLHLPHHASGVNALDLLLSASKRTLHVLSGGDDQLVTYSRVLMDASLRVVETTRYPQLHTAQVTATKLVLEVAPNSSEVSVIGYTSGVDQQLCRVNLRTQQLEHQFHACVADVKGLCVDSTGTCYLYGCGLQVCRFEEDVSRTKL